MKKFLAIILFVIHLFNLGGYQILFNFIETESSLAIVERLDGGDFDENELIEVKIHYPLPYAANQPSFERYNGEIEVGGVHYNYVKRKMINDTLIILCMPNSIKTELNAAKSDLIAGFNSIQTESPSSQKSPVTTTVKPFAAEYNNNFVDIDFNLSTVVNIQHYYSFPAELLSAELQAPFQPPQI